MSIVQRKQQLRRLCIQRRDAMEPALRARKSQRICQALASRLGRCAVIKPTVAVYAAMNSEVDLSAFIEHAFACGCPVAFPCMMRISGAAQRAGLDAPRSHMAFRFVSQRQYAAGGVRFIDDPLHVFEENATGLSPYNACPPASIGFMVVPMVAFDDKGDRLGYGGGNYDRFLPALPADAQVFGVAFDEQRAEHLPTAAHDVPLTVIHA